MTLESVFLILAISALSLVLIYEVVFILFFNQPFKKAGKVVEEAAAADEDVIVQPRPLGYSAPPAGKIQQCSTPVFEIPELSNPETNPEMEVDRVQEVKVPLAQNVRKGSPGKAPTIVVSSPTSSF